TLQAVQVLIDSATTEPIAAPVARAGVSRPPTAPERRNAAVRTGFSTRMTAAAPSVRPLFRLTVRTLLPLPGSSGHQSEQTPVSSPAAAIAGINSHERGAADVFAHFISRLNSRPTPSASGARITANAVSTYDSTGFGHANGAASCV